MIDLSILIVTYNPGSILHLCLASIPAGAAGLTVEVILVDNASSDGQAQQAAAHDPGIRFAPNTENRGFAGGNNQALALAAGEFVVLLNPDVILRPGSLTTLVQYLQAQPSVGIVGPRVFDGEGRVALSAYGPYRPLSILWQYWGLDRVFPYGVFGRYRQACETATAPFPVAWVQGCCLLARRAVYEQIGGLDEAFFLFAEEPDWCERGAQAGWQTVYVPGAEVEHHESSSVSRYPERKIRHHHLSPLIYFGKRGQGGAVRGLKLGFTVELLLKLMIRLVQQASGRGGTPPAVYWWVLRQVWAYPDSASSAS